MLIAIQVELFRETKMRDRSRTLQKNTRAVKRYNYHLGSSPLLFPVLSSELSSKSVSWSGGDKILHVLR